MGANSDNSSARLNCSKFGQLIVKKIIQKFGRNIAYFKDYKL